MLSRMRIGMCSAVLPRLCVSMHAAYNTFTLYTTLQQHLHEHYLCISRHQKYYLKIVSQKLDLYTSIYGNSELLKNAYCT